MDPNVMNADLCKAMGLDGQRVRAFTLRVEAGRPPTLTVERYVKARDVDALVTAVECLHLVPRAPAEGT